MTKDRYQELYQNILQKSRKYKSQSNFIAVIRFLSMVVAVGVLLYGYFQNLHFLYVIAIILLGLFIFCVYQHQQVYRHIEYYQSLSQVYLEHMERMEGRWKAFEENGQEFLDENDYVSQDLDIFGNCSLFQMMNITFTDLGKKYLANSLKGNKQDVHELRDKQEAINELSLHEDFIIKLQTYGYSVRYEKNSLLYTQNSNNYKKIPTFIFVLPMITIMSFFFACFSILNPYAYVICEIGFASQLIISILFIRHHQVLFEPVSKIHKIFQKYEMLFSIIEKEDFESCYLNTLKNRLFGEINVLKGMKRLSVISQKAKNRYNIFAYIFLNGFGLYDLYVRNQYIDWQKEYQKNMYVWFDTLAQIEVLISFSVLSMDGYCHCMPEIVENSKPVLSFKNLKHPLIDSSKSIGNSYQLKDNICIITGSNMSGKTTFMRTVALNLILAYAGGFVFADQMCCSYMHIMTSMRVKDNVEEGISTFYGELLRIKDMIQYSKKELPLICFIDEIFKGTNSLDRIAGAKATIEKLSLPYVLTFLTTHDFELCQVKDVQCENYHFDEYYKDNQIYFDYQMKKGQSQTTNGQFLLKQLGIME